MKHITWTAIQKGDEKSGKWWEVCGETIIDIICVVADSDGQPAEAHARLIAAAPQLLEACKLAERAILSLCDVTKEYAHTYQMLKQATAVAEPTP